MYDKDLEYLLEVIGHAVASHVMCRAHLSGGTGRNEEPLTADVRDLFDLFDVCGDYLACVGSSSSMTITVTDLSRSQESKTGADFVLAMKGVDWGPGGRRTIRKVVGVQAKRQDYTKSPPAYMKPTVQGDHGLQAKKMEARYGKGNAYFAFYHDEAVLTLSPPAAMSSVPPVTYYAMPSRGDHMFFCAHPDMTRSPTRAFIEPSAYRKWRLMQLGKHSLPADYAWGIALIDVSVVRDSNGLFVDPKGRSALPLPAPSLVVATGSSLPAFLVALADCVEGTARTADDYDAVLNGLRRLPPDDPELPDFIVEVAFAAGGPDNDIAREWSG